MGTDPIQKLVTPRLTWFERMRDTRSAVTLSDTSLKAREVYFQRLKGMTPSERLGLGAALWNAGHSVQRAAVLRTNPDADEAEITFRLAVTRFQSELARKASENIMSPADAFEPLRSALEQAGIRYAIGGSWASTAFGELRFTNGVDIVVEFTEQNLEWLLANMPDTFYVDAAEA